MPARPLGPQGRLWVALILLGIALLWLLWADAHASLPARVPSHFNFKGQADDYGGKGHLLFITLCFTLVSLSLLVLVRFRFLLVNRWPELLNLPAFFLYAPLLPPERRAVWLNRYFETLLFLDVELTAYFLLVQWGLVQGARTGQLPPWFTPVALAFPLVLILPGLLQFFRLGRQLREESKRYTAP